MTQGLPGISHASAENERRLVDLCTVPAARR